ncbi:MAG TPA: phosphatase PAP2 family protein [Gammaproteobacteria bacterium]|nr:phosphatase PAP2 family protein [Gammaproteobacteria bacterium]
MGGDGEFAAIYSVAVEPHLPVVFVLVLVLCILVLRLVAKVLAPVLFRGFVRIYSRIIASSRAGVGGRLANRGARRFPRVTAHMVRRLSSRHFTGLPLTLLIAAAIYAAVLAAELTVELVFDPQDIAESDARVDSWLEPFRSGALIAAFAWITDLGNSATLVALAAVTTAFALVTGHSRNVLPLWVTVLGTQIFTWAGKFALARERPEFLQGITALSPSFPSAHASSSLAVYGFIAYMLARETGSLARRFEIAFWIAVLIGLIGLSRMFLRVHFGSDVVAGYLVGGLWLVIGIAIAELRRARLPGP